MQTTPITFHGWFQLFWTIAIPGLSSDNAVIVHCHHFCSPPSTSVIIPNQIHDGICVKIEESTWNSHSCSSGETHLTTLAEGPRDSICPLLFMPRVSAAYLVPAFTYFKSHMQVITGIGDVKILQYLVGAARPQVCHNRSLLPRFPCCSVDNSNFSLCFSFTKTKFHSIQCNFSI